MGKNVYTEILLDNIVQDYVNCKSHAERSTTIDWYCRTSNLTRASVQGKLVSAGVYIAKERTSKNGEPVILKSELVNKISDIIGKGDLSSLELVTKSTLKKILRYIEK